MLGSISADPNPRSISSHPWSKRKPVEMLVGCTHNLRQECIDDCIATLKLLVAKGARLGTVLYKEANHADVAVLEALIDLGAKPNSRKGEALALAIGSRKVELAEMLIRRGASLDGAYGKKAAEALSYGDKPLGDLIKRLWIQP